MTKVKALPIDVYRSKDCDGTDLDCTNGGISSKYDTLYLVCEHGFKEIDENDERLVKIVTRTFHSGRTHLSIEPYKSCPKGMIGWMYGGNIACASDSRFPSEYPLEIHDRCETAEQYDALSR